MTDQPPRPRFTVAPVDPEAESAATDRARQAAEESARAAAWMAAHSATETDPVTHGCTINGQPAMPILISEHTRLVAENARLTAELAALRTVARGYCPECGRGDAAPTADDWLRERQRADQLAADLEQASHEAARWAAAESADAAAGSYAGRAEAAENTLRDVLDSFITIRSDDGTLLHHSCPNISPAQFDRWRHALPATRPAATQATDNPKEQPGA